MLGVYCDWTLDGAAQADANMMPASGDLYRYRYARGGAMRTVAATHGAVHADIMVQAKDGYVSVLASCELDYAALQRLLYDLEAGMPFLFIEQVVAQTPQTGSAETGRMRLLLSVAGRWGSDK